MAMDVRMLRVEDVPVLNEHDSPQEQIRVLYDFMFKLHEQLRYILSNLSTDNWNEAALQELLNKLTVTIGGNGT